MGKFKPGESGNAAGRPKGARNRTTEQLRQLIQDFIEDNWTSLQSDFDAMKPAERASFRERLLRYLVPEAVSFERLTEEQLKQFYEYLQKRGNEQSDDKEED